MNAADTDRPDDPAERALSDRPVGSSAPAKGRGSSPLTPWHWLFSVVAMAAAVAVVAGMGQPRPAAPASGNSVPVRAANAAPVQMSPVLVVSRGVTDMYDPSTGYTSHEGLPPGARARLALGLTSGATVIVGLDGLGRPEAYFSHGPHLRRLGPAMTGVRSADGRTAWIVWAGVARQIMSDGTTGPAEIVIPAGCALIGANSHGLIVTGASGLLPGHTWIVAPGQPPRLLVPGRAVAVSEHRVLIARGNSLRLFGLDRQLVARLPWPSALVASGQGSLSPNGRSYALVARTADRARLVVGSMVGRTPTQPSVIPLDGGRARPAPAPVWVAGGVVVAVRPDGRLVAYMHGRPHGWLLSDGPTAVGALATL